MDGRVGGLAEAAGKVRKGNPSGTGRLKANVQNHASTPVGYGELRTLARDRRTLRDGLLRVGLPRVLAGIGSIKKFARSLAMVNLPLNTVYCTTQLMCN